MAVCVAVGLVCFTSGCAHPAPVPIRLPTTAAVRAPIVAAKASNARAVKLAAQAVKHGIVAGSEEARELSLATSTTDSQLGQALAKVDQLTQQLLEAQGRVDALQRFAAAETARADATQRKLEATAAELQAVETSRGHWRFACFALVAAGLTLVSLIGTELEDILRKAETLAAHEALVFGREVEGAALKIGWVVKTLAKVSALMAFV